MIYNKRFRGFTLIEVLIVVAIIGILVLALTLSMRAQREKAEDARAKADLERLRIAFEDYYSDYNCYPPSEWFDSADDCNADYLQPYLSTIPCDRRTGEPYVIERDSADSCNWYKLYTTLDYPQENLCSETGSSLGNYGVGSTNVTVSVFCETTTPSSTALPSTTPGSWACFGVVCNTAPNPSSCPITFADRTECDNFCVGSPPGSDCSGL
jgi:prepilin-type N-terminal cleavage/methylation domain-containing protein